MHKISREMLEFTHIRQAGTKFTFKQVIYSTQCDYNGNIKLPELFSLLLQASNLQTAALAISPLPSSLGWAITTHHMTITRLPHANEVITFGTQATSWNPFFCYRDFWAEDASGTKLVKLTAVFVILDLKKRKLTRIKPQYVVKYGAARIKKIIRQPEVAPIVAPTSTWCQGYQTHFWDIDSNHHVNNVHYLEWMCAVLPDTLNQNYCPKEISINYAREVLPNAAVTSRAQWDAKTQTTYHVIESKAVFASEAKIVWRKNE